MTDDDGRDRGILSPADRNYLRNPDEYSRQASHEREKKIKERIRNALLDISLLASPEVDGQFLAEALRWEGPDLVMEHNEAWKKGPFGVIEVDDEMMRTLVDAIVLAGRNLTISKYTALVEEATETLVRRYHPGSVLVDARYEPDIENPDQAYGRAKGKLSMEQDLTDAEIRLLLEQGEVDAETVAEHVRGGKNRQGEGQADEE